MKAIICCTTLVMFGLCVEAQPAQLFNIEGQATVVERGPDHRVWQATNEYCEIGTGMHYWKDGWQEAKAQFQIFPGGAVAAEGRFQLIVAPDIAAEVAVDLLTPDGKRFRSSPAHTGEMVTYRCH
jgi:hypothetical protein